MFIALKRDNHIHAIKVHTASFQFSTFGCFSIHITLVLVWHGVCSLQGQDVGLLVFTQ
jgi:hypothetical protein